MKSYHILSRLKFLNKYSYKFLFVAFVGIHIPLLGLIGYLLASSEISTTSVILVTLGLTLMATGATLVVLNNLLAPINEGKKALREFVDNNTLPQLPTIYNDEVGEMLKNIQYTVERLHFLLMEKEDIISLVSHDLQTPINQLIGMQEILQDEKDVDKRNHYIGLMHEITKKQRAFLDSMIKILKSKEVEINPANFETVKIAELVRHIISQNNPNIQSKQIQIETDLTDDPKGWVHKSAFTEVLNNLLSNAIKFSYKSGHIKISANADPKQIRIRFADNGMGFSEQIGERLFKKFASGQTGTENEPSTGLGLYLSQKIMEKHKGKIHAESKGENKGACFTVILPHRN